MTTKNDLSTYLSIALLSVFAFSAKSEAVERETKYLRCPRGKVSGGQQLDTVIARSRLDCATKCSNLVGCVGVNVCPTDLSTQVACTPIGDHNPADCDNLSNATSPSCLFLLKSKAKAEEHTSVIPETTAVPDTTAAELQTTELGCQNGGTLNGDTCQCLPQYSGRMCERLIRDCTEVFDNGYQASAYNGAYDIQPITAPASFKVYCNFQYGYGITYALRRQTFAYDPSWEDAKLPAGEDLSVNPSSRNFFIGLENLRHLVTQADYTNLIFMGYPGGNWGWTNYHNFSVGSSSTDYVITYDDFTFNPTYPADNGFPDTSLPITFNTFDHGSCYAGKSNTPGWYGTDCSGDYSVFASDLKWPIGGTPTSLDHIDFDMVRDSPFYDQ